MTTPAQRHRQRVTAATAAESPAAERRFDDEQHLMLAALWECRRRLKDIKSIQAKIKAKREMLPQFAAYVDGVLEADTGEPDEIVMTDMLWSFDVGDLTRALTLAEYALRHGLETPDRYKRDTPSVVAEQTAEEVLQALEEVEGKDDEAIESGHLADYAEIAQAQTADADIHDQIRAKLHKARGYALRAQGGHDEQALHELQAALDMHAKVGVKKDIERLERNIKNAGASA